MPREIAKYLEVDVSKQVTYATRPKSLSWAVVSPCIPIMSRVDRKVPRQDYIPDTKVDLNVLETALWEADS